MTGLNLDVLFSASLRVVDLSAPSPQIKSISDDYIRGVNDDCLLKLVICFSFFQFFFYSQYFEN